eukprot:1145307-Pelagomonas_calceolata.AAC.8
MVTMGGDLQPGRLADLLVAGLCQPKINVSLGMRGNEEVRSSTTPARQLHELNIQNLHAKTFIPSSTSY